MTCKLASLLLALIVMFTIAAPAAAGEPVSKGELAAIRAANPWLMPTEPGLELKLEHLSSSEPPVVEDVALPRNMGMTFNVPSFSIFRPGKEGAFTWVDENGKRVLELIADDDNYIRYSVGNGPVQGGTWYGYFSAGATRWIGEFDDLGRLVVERCYLKPRAEAGTDAAEKPEELLYTFTYSYDDTFSPGYPLNAVIDGDMHFDIEFQFVGDRWMVKRSSSSYEGKPGSLLVIQQKKPLF